MNILINASNLKVGGGIQVADSICRELDSFPQHTFVVVLSSYFNDTYTAIKEIPNVTVYVYDVKNNLSTLFFGRDKYFDKLVRDKSVDAVLTIFGPSRWIPKVPHLSGFAQGHIVLPDSPFWGILPFIRRIKLWAKLKLIELSLNKSSDFYYTENPIITERLQKKFPRKKIYTVTNNANQVFQNPAQWDCSIELPTFEGVTLLTVAANYPHKNLSIIIPTCHYLEKNYPNLIFRFVLTIHENDLELLDECARKHIVFLGPVKIDQVPFLYKQSDIMFLPTLLECFSASYAEAMLMKRPIITTDLVFARGLCGDAAYYYNAISPVDLGKAIVRLTKDATLRNQLVVAGEKQLQTFDSIEQRANKLINIVESIA